MRFRKSYVAGDKLLVPFGCEMTWQKNRPGKMPKKWFPMSTDDKLLDAHFKGFGINASKCDEGMVHTEDDVIEAPTPPLKSKKAIEDFYRRGSAAARELNHTAFKQDGASGGMHIHFRPRNTQHAFMVMRLVYANPEISLVFRDWFATEAVDCSYRIRVGQAFWDAGLLAGWMAQHHSHTQMYGYKKCVYLEQNYNKQWRRFAKSPDTMKEHLHVFNLKPALMLTSRDFASVRTLTRVDSPIGRYSYDVPIEGDFEEINSKETGNRAWVSNGLIWDISRTIGMRIDRTWPTMEFRQPRMPKNQRELSLMLDFFDALVRLADHHAKVDVAPMAEFGEARSYNDFLIKHKYAPACERFGALLDRLGLKFNDYVSLMDENMGQWFAHDAAASDMCIWP